MPGGQGGAIRETIENVKGGKRGTEKAAIGKRSERKGAAEGVFYFCCFLQGF